MSERILELVGVDGTRIRLVCSDLLTSEFHLRTDSTAFAWAAAPSIQARTRPGIHGAIVEQVNHPPHSLRLPILVRANDEQELAESMATLARLLRPGGVIRLVHTRPDGDERDLVARYSSGGERTVIRHHQQRYVEVPIIVTAYHPFWRWAKRQNKTTEVLNDGAGAGSNPIVFDNLGDVASWPRITVRGPFSNFEALNMTTGQVWRCIETANSGFDLQVDTDPRNFHVRFGGARIDSVIDPLARDFWPLRPGPNRVVFRAVTDGAAPTVSVVWDTWSFSP